MVALLKRLIRTEVSHTYCSWNPLCFSRQEYYSIIGALGIIGLGVLTQLLNLRWEVVALALIPLAWGFKPRIERAIRSKRGDSQHFQMILGGNRLRDRLRYVTIKYNQPETIIQVGMQDTKPITQELYTVSNDLTELRGEYRGVWDADLRNRVTEISGALSNSGVALSEKRFDDAKAQMQIARDNSKILINFLELEPEKPSNK